MLLFRRQCSNARFPAPHILQAHPPPVRAWAGKRPGRIPWQFSGKLVHGKLLGFDMMVRGGGRGAILPPPNSSYPLLKFVFHHTHRGERVAEIWTKRSAIKMSFQGRRREEVLLSVKMHIQHDNVPKLAQTQQLAFAIIFSFIFPYFYVTFRV